MGTALRYVQCENYRIKKKIQYEHTVGSARSRRKGFRRGP